MNDRKIKKTTRSRPNDSSRTFHCSPLKKCSLVFHRGQTKRSSQTSLEKNVSNRPPPVVFALARTAHELPQVPFQRLPPPESPPPPEPEPPRVPTPPLPPRLPTPQQAKLEQVDEPEPRTAKDLSPAEAPMEYLEPEPIPYELLDLPAAELRRLGPEQFCQPLLHWLPPDTFLGAEQSFDTVFGDFGEELYEQDPFPPSATYPQLVVAASQQSQLTAASLRHSLTQPEIQQPEKIEQPFESDEEYVEEEESPASEPVFELDLGAFELVDSGVTAEELLNNEDPVIYHKDMPVHSVHHDTVQTEAAIENLMSAPPGVLSTQAPPIMVADNYCFAVDGDHISMADIQGDEQWWRHTSRPTKYFYSQDLRRFYRVNCLSVKGKVVSARLAAATPAMGGRSAPEEAAAATAQSGDGDMSASASFSYQQGGTTPRRMFSSSITQRHPSVFGTTPTLITPTSSPRMPRRTHFAPSSPTWTAQGSLPGTAAPSAFPSFSATPRSSVAFHSLQHSHQPSIAATSWRSDHVQRGEQVDLMNVFKVVRFYSFWRTCTSFHRIVTVIERVGEAPLRDRSSGSRERVSGSGSREPSTSSAPGRKEKPMPGIQESPVSPSSSKESASDLPQKHFSMPQDSSAGSSGASSERNRHDFQKRFFVQYLWRNAKPSDKARVQREFDPRRQRLLQIVANPAARKRMTGAWRIAGVSSSASAQFKREETMRRRFKSGGGAESLSDRPVHLSVSSGPVGASSRPTSRTGSPMLLKRAQTSADMKYSIRRKK